jgi:SAM-dependent methyltransferase
MITGTSTASDLRFYVCAACKHALQQEDSALRCGSCSEKYPIRGGIPDFIREELAESNDAVFRRMRGIDRMAAIYESKLWYPLVLNVYGGWHSATLPGLVSTVARTLQSTTGRVLDVACGPGTYDRRIASPTREVFGIDISKGMLRQGAAYIAKEGIGNVHFARACVEALPFESEFFDAAICCGSLHNFADTVTALREIARVMKPAAVLCAFTFTAGQGGVLKFRRVREWMLRNYGMHVFDLRDLKQSLAAAGFVDFQPGVSGSILTFSARRESA